nr:UDP-glucuronosyl/UDP-glucosyltransferase [Tanacetum cinerariifolium]
EESCDTLNWLTYEESYPVHSTTSREAHVQSSPISSATEDISPNLISEPLDINLLLNMATKQEGEQDDSEGDEKRACSSSECGELFLYQFPTRMEQENTAEIGTRSKVDEGCVDSIPIKIKETYGITMESCMAEKVISPGHFSASTKTHGRNISHFPAQAHKAEILKFESRVWIPCTQMDEPVVHATNEHQMSPFYIGEKKMSPSNIGEK